MKKTDENVIKSIREGILCSLAGIVVASGVMTV